MVTTSFTSTSDTISSSKAATVDSSEHSDQILSPTKAPSSSMSSTPAMSTITTPATTATTPTALILAQHPRNLMLLPPECLALIVQWVAIPTIQELYPLMCVNKAFFGLVVPLLYRDPFRLSARWVWKRSVYKGVIERQTKLIRTLLLCCTRTINRVTPIVDPQMEKKRHSKYSNSGDNNNSNNNNSSVSRKLPGPLGRAITVVRRSDKDLPNDSIAIATATTMPTSTSIMNRNDISVVIAEASVNQQQQTYSSDTSLRVDESERATVSILPVILPNPRINVSAHQSTSDRSILKSLFHKLGNSCSGELSSTSYAKGNKRLSAQPPSSTPTQTRIEQIPIVWDAENQRPETRKIPGLGRPNTSKLKFPPELAKTVIRLASEPPPMVNYLSYVTHTDVRSWSAASNMTLVHQILGDARPSWHARLQDLVKKTSKRIMGKHPTFNRQGEAGDFDQNGVNSTFISDTRHDLMDDLEDDDEDGIMDMTFSLRHGGSNNGTGSNGGNTGGGRFRRWRRGRTKRNRNLWDLQDVDFLELVLLFYTSAKMETLSLGMNCSHWYHPSLNVLLPGIPERLSGLRRIVIDHADTIMHNTVSVPQVFIQRHQKAFPGQLREIQVRQSYHYSYDMSKSVLQIIKTMDRIEVLDLSIWTGVFSGLESICTDHLRKLLICHHMDVPRPDMFDELVKRCPVLEELSIIVPHPKLFSWAVERRNALMGITGSSLPMASTMNDAFVPTTMTRSRKNLLSSRTASLWSDRQAEGGHGEIINLPPLKSLTLFGHTPDVVAAFKDVIYAFQDTLESIQVSMYSDITKPPDAHFEVPPPHFAITDDPPQSTSFFGISLIQDPLQVNHYNTAPTGSQSTLDPFNAPPELSSMWHQEILTGIHGAGGTGGTGNNNLQDSTSFSGPSASGHMVSNIWTTHSPSFLTWNWPLPRLRTMSLRGPVVAYFDLQLLRFCPQLTDLALSYHCSRLPRLVYPGTVAVAAAAAAVSATVSTTSGSTASPGTGSSSSPSSSSALSFGSLAGSRSRGASLSTTNSPSTMATDSTLIPTATAVTMTPPVSRFPKIMVCDSLAYKWGIHLQEEHRSLVIV
ncbi:hypothetical protein BX616_000344 [Lobosporangium transversale]|uniref:Uncharacterized protein n=1 Tax=Lobosporangium transversale TaxID=64571 RepID=A0A1Y2G731_9FUNG|nr:hypothetical protein BCR41DRAFT_363765 [Lobosporangium transversale]KAF9907737.1 hypothetical protein BX616_000344 [Lobosporangium transversale]ORY99666.1 hypothetical protein BCR41DRAFT_363765 [Lobosporangium transversale]|eukprot:XP_021875930.1 hypothetical protein BCR41DRAFT_363765 [Lobosporangium transversale]